MLVRVADRRPGRILACLDLDFVFTHILADPNPWLCGSLLYRLLRIQPRCRLLVVSTLLVGEGSSLGLCTASKAITAAERSERP